MELEVVLAFLILMASTMSITRGLFKDLFTWKLFKDGTGGRKSLPEPGEQVAKLAKLAKKRVGNWTVMSAS